MEVPIGEVTLWPGNDWQPIITVSSGGSSGAMPSDYYLIGRPPVVYTYTTRKVYRNWGVPNQ